MLFIYKNKQYELCSLDDMQGSSCGVAALFEIEYASYSDDGKKRTKHTEEEYLNQEELNVIIFEEKRYINYFFIEGDHQTNIDNAIYYIQHEYDEEFDKLKFLLKKLKKAILELEKDFNENNSTKGSLDNLEYAQSDLYDYVKENIEIDEDNDIISEMKSNGVDLNSQAQIREYLDQKGVSKNTQIEVVREMGFTPFEEEDWR